MDYNTQMLKTLIQEATSNSAMSRFDSILELLWNIYSSENPVDDGRIRQAENVMAPIWEELSVKNSDRLFDMVLDLCQAYQRAAFLEGIQVGARLVAELSAPACDP